MRVGGATVRGAAGGYELRADVHFDGDREDTLVTVRLPEEAAPWIVPRADAFVPALALLAVHIGEDLVVDGPVDPGIVASARAVVATHAEYQGLRPVQIGTAEPAAPVARSGRERLLLSTRGIDSEYSLMGLRHELTGLVYLAGIDAHWSAATHAAVAAATRAAADAAGLPLLVASTNLRAVIEPEVGFLEAHHAVFGAALIAMGAGVDTAYAAGDTNGVPTLWDLLAPAGTAFVLHAHDVPRYDKARAVAADRDRLARVRVCYQEDLPGNCGRCRKCLMSAVFLAAGHRDADLAGVFPPEVLDPEHIRATAPALIDDFNAFYRHAADIWRTCGWDRAVRDLGRHRPAAADAWRDLTARFVDGIAPAVAGGDDPAVGLDLRERAAGSGLRVAAGPFTAGWTSGRLPVRPPAADAERVRRACRSAPSRPVRWAYLGEHHPRLGALVAAARAAWGPGLIHQLSPDDEDLNLTVAQRRELLDRVRVRLVLGPDDDIAPGPLLAAVEHGCLPLQVVEPGVKHALAAAVPARLASALVTLEELPSIGDDALGRRMDDVLSVLLAGSFERDLMLAGCHV